jgi:hypothetical protein
MPEYNGIVWKNAVTRAKVEAVLFVQGDDERFSKDGVLALLKSGVDTSTVGNRRRPARGK